METEPKNNSSIILIIILILIILILGIGIYFCINKINTAKIYERCENRIAELKTNPKLTIDDIEDLHNVLPFSEWQNLFETAKKQVTKSIIEGNDFHLVFKWKKDDWVLFHVYSINKRLTDLSQLYLEKTDDGWKAYGPGTAFEELYNQQPELFQ